MFVGNYCLYSEALLSIIENWSYTCVCVSVLAPLIASLIDWQINEVLMERDYYHY